MRRKRALQERKTRRFGDAKHDGRLKDLVRGRVLDDRDLDKITTPTQSVRSA